MQELINKCMNESCLETMKKMPENSLDLVVTSPPYGKLRSYNDNVKKEVTFSGGYSYDFENISKELYRVMKPGAILAWVIGYETIKGSRSLEQQKQMLYFVEQCGFTFYDHLIYEKSSFSFPDKSRYYNIWESIYLLSKGKPKTFNPICDREVKYQQSRGKATQRQQDGSLKNTERGIIKYNKFARRNNIWRYATGYGNSTRDKIAYEHPAIFPEKLAEDLIKSYSNEGDLIYDPFLGSGTTAKMSITNNRNWIGSELSQEYCDIIDNRIKIQKI